MDQMLTPLEVEVDDRTLVRRFQGGDRRAFDLIVERHFEPVGRLAARLMGWRGDVQDVVQETFLAAYERLPAFEGRSELRTWLVSIALNKSRSAIRRRRLRFWCIGEEIYLEPDSPLEHRERAEQVRAAVRALGDTLREVVVMHYLEGHSVEETAKVLNLRINTVEVRLHRARQRLGVALQELA